MHCSNQQSLTSFSLKIDREPQIGALTIVVTGGGGWEIQKLEETLFNRKIVKNSDD
jgi:hypothetical protein